jgi:hypothetical protein
MDDVIRELANNLAGVAIDMAVDEIEDFFLVVQNEWSTIRQC